MFVPPRCPYLTCPSHLAPRPGFCYRRGFYHPRCRSHPVQRFRCRSCTRSFSRQSFRADRYHKKPHLNAPFLRLMVSCVGLRQAARVLGVARRTVEHRFEWLAAHAALAHANLLRHARLTGPLQLDELESFESNRFQPLSVPVLLHRRSLFLLATGVGPLRRKGRMSPAQKRARLRHEKRHGRRPSRSDAVVRHVLAALRDLLPADTPVVLETDRKPSYARIGERLFGGRFVWRAYSARVRRDRSNPLFAINHTNARLRHYLARLRRRTWCVSKKARCLQQHLQIAALWANWCRGITNRTRTTPAQALGLAGRACRPQEVLSWRQDWSQRSIPLVA